jgi:RNA polymerase sigma factor (sigma-70 family)
MAESAQSGPDPLPVGIDQHDSRPGDSEPSPACAGEHAILISKLFEDNNRALINFLLAQLPNEQEAREVAQEAYVKLLQLDRPEAISFLRSYLFRIAANLAVDRVRRRIRKERIERVDIFEDWSGEASVEREVLAAQEVRLLHEVIAELEPRYRRALLLHKFRELSVADVAADLQITPRRARTYIARAVLYCRLRLDGHDAQDAMKTVKEMLP